MTSPIDTKASPTSDVKADTLMIEHPARQPPRDLGGRYSFQRVFGKVDNTAFYEEALEKYGFDGAIDPADEKRVVRKIDWLILPWWVRLRLLAELCADQRVVAQPGNLVPFLLRRQDDSVVSCSFLFTDRKSVV